MKTVHTFSSLTTNRQEIVNRKRVPFLLSIGSYYDPEHWIPFEVHYIPLPCGAGGPASPAKQIVIVHNICSNSFLPQTLILTDIISKSFCNIINVEIKAIDH